MNRSEKLMIVQTLALIGFASWAFGGMIFWAKPWILALCATAAIPLFLHCREQWSKRYKNVRPGSIAKTIPWPWIFFLLLGVVSILNIGYEPVPLEHGGGFTSIDYIAWLPSAVSADKAVDKLQLLTAFLFQGAVLYHVLQTRKAIRTLMILLYCNSLVLAIFGTVQKLLGVSEIYGSVASPNRTFFGSIIYHNHWSAFTLLSLGLGAGLFFHFHKKYTASSRRGSPAPLIAVSLLLLALTIPLSTSRSGTLLLTLFVIIFAAKSLQLILAKRRHLTVLTKKMSLIGGTAALILIGGILYSLLESAIDFQLQKTDRQVSQLLEHGDWEGRYYSSRDTWKMAMAEPFWGWGPGNFSTVFPLFQGEEISGNPQRPQFYEYAHNDWFEYLSEFGFIGMAILLSVPIWILARLLWIRRMTTLGAWPLLSCGLIGLYAFIDFPFGNHAVFLLFVTTFALAAKDYQKKPRQGKATDSPKSFPPYQTPQNPSPPAR